jgi:hypothetical protein
MMRKSTGYSQELMEMDVSCNVPTGRTTVQFSNCNIIVVGSKESKTRVLEVSIVGMLMDAPKSTSVFGKEHPWI